MEETNHIINKLHSDKNVTEEEFQNFVHRVTEVEKIVKKLASSDPKEQECGKRLADEILERNIQRDICEDDVKIKTNRSLINKYPSENVSSSDSDKMSRGRLFSFVTHIYTIILYNIKFNVVTDMFMKSVEDDAKKRAEDRKVRNERAETLKRIANGAFKEGDYEKAVTYFSKALEQRKDSTVLWNNRALSHMHLGLFEKALHDFTWALKVNDCNLKALLNSAKCYMHLRNKEKSREYIQMARDKNPHFNKFINEFEESIETEFNKTNIQIIGHDEVE
ncbi:tetratricopeptide repeat protein 12 isoform X1 [Pseudomyrmex gracilis]|uniref:tetratricopeptide repeat protein 12 isoform X1 n=1 Tax=Pseudomyrmex gracilis TaxID=219809 RepID=UPI0009958E21|nr:tetratricopeptide repeat protein 12 isoform X1 [Pseudomyrmex gracilis]